MGIGPSSPEDASPATGQNEASKRGWLHKAGEHNSAFRRRYFVLSAGRLRYYKAQEDQYPAGVIIITGATVKAIAQWRMHIAPKNTSRIFLLAAADTTERNEWVDELQSVATGAPRRGAAAGSQGDFSIALNQLPKYNTDRTLLREPSMTTIGTGKLPSTRDVRSIPLRDCSDEQLLHEVRRATTTTTTTTAAAAAATAATTTTITSS